LAGHQPTDQLDGGDGRRPGRTRKVGSTDSPSLSAQETGSATLTGTSGVTVVVTVVVTGIINGAIAIVNLPGLPLLLVGLVPPTAIAVIVRADIARDP
jgi:hypothetical protein